MPSGCNGTTATGDAENKSTPVIGHCGEGHKTPVPSCAACYVADWEKIRESRKVALVADPHRYESDALVIVKGIKDVFLPEMDDNDGGEILHGIMNLVRKVREEARSSVSEPPPEEWDDGNTWHPSHRLGVLGCNACGCGGRHEAHALPCQAAAVSESPVSQKRTELELEEALYLGPVPSPQGNGKRDDTPTESESPVSPEPSGTTGPADAPLSARWQELFWALPPGEMRSKLRALEIDMGAALDTLRTERETAERQCADAERHANAIEMAADAGSHKRTPEEIAKEIARGGLCEHLYPCNCLAEAIAQGIREGIANFAAADAGSHETLSVELIEKFNRRAHHDAMVASNQCNLGGDGMLAVKSLILHAMIGAAVSTLAAPAPAALREAIEALPVTDLDGDDLIDRNDVLALLPASAPAAPRETK